MKSILNRLCLNNRLNHKLIITAVVISSIGVNLHGQGRDTDRLFIYSFEPNEVDEKPNDYKEINNYDYLEFDDTGLWQIGKPNKADWDSAWIGEYVLITDTVNLIDTNTKASFTFKFQRPYYSNCFFFWDVEIYHQYDSPHKKTGAYIEYSYDKGETWTNINYDTLAYALYITNTYGEDVFNEELDCGQLGLNGTASWETSLLVHELASTKVFDVWLRFTFDNNDTIAHKGWAIDELKFYISYWCEGIGINERNNALNAKVYPNPVSQGSVLEFNNPNKQEFYLQIYDILGNKVYESYVCENKHKLPYNLLKAGYYLYELKGINSTAVSGRFMVE